MPLSVFSITVAKYQHIRFDEADASLLQIIIWGLCIGAVLASLLSLYQQNVPGRLVRALLRAEAHTADTAKTLDELGLSRRPLITRELRRGTVLKKFVCSAADGEEQGKTSSKAENKAEGAENAPSAAAKEVPLYYIPTELKYRAEIRYAKKGNSLLSFAITVALSVAMGVLLMKLIPFVLSMIDAIL